MKPRSEDLTWLLSAWDYDEDNAVRRIRAENGREVLQVRLPLGVEQYEMHGRPDGKRPMKQESWLHHYRSRASAAIRQGKAFVLGEEEFANLYQEGLLFYQRYVLFFQIREYQLCARDTSRNLKLLDFVSRYASQENSEQLEQFRPYIHRMNVMARALDTVQEGNDILPAVEILRSGIRDIESMSDLPDNEVFDHERARSLKSLNDLLEGLLTQASATASQRKQRKQRKQTTEPGHAALEMEMKQAIREEDYERAALLRDEIAKLGRDGGPPGTGS